MSTSLPVIKIKAKANHHARFLILIGSVLMSVTVILGHYYWLALKLVLIFLTLLALIIIMTGLLKRFEPNYSLLLTPIGMDYCHRHGYWHLDWQQIQIISQVKETYGLIFLELPYIGIRLCDLDSLATQISPRLANRLIHEQKPLIAFAIMHQLLSLEQGQLNFSPYKLISGKVVKGPLAAFLHHSKALYAGFGFHLFIPENNTDREIDEFCQLLKQCKSSSAHYYQQHLSHSSTKLTSR